ncbi:MAG: LysM peptidoglycan-binding domain-containing protein [Oscillospiraceae bacterium]|nr:LysM peptidoglycan-binding domain-containing protein [Oscillospiraceae bacterium]
MILHTIAAGETLEGIARQYGVPARNLAADNGVAIPEKLPVGMILLVVIPTATHTVTEGETLYGIASRYGLTLRTLWRNNLFLNGSEDVQTGDILYLDTQTDRIGAYMTGGYVYPFVDRTLLNQTLPLISGIMPFTYGFRPDGTVLPLDDGEILNAAFRYSTSPVMHLSTLTEDGNFSSELAAALLRDETAMQTLTAGVLETLRRKGYYGLDVDFEFLGAENAALYAAFLSRLRETLNAAGYPVMAALAPKTRDDQPGALYEGHDYAAIGQAVNCVLLMTYEWGYTYGPPMAVSPIRPVRNVIEYALTRIPAEKIFLGVSNYGYDFTLPYVQGLSMARSLSVAEAFLLAGEVGAEIQYDETVQAPFFEYTKEGVQHVVWFEDARSLSVRLNLLPEYGLRGALYWNFMRPNPQNLALINSLLYPRVLHLF